MSIIFGLLLVLGLLSLMYYGVILSYAGINSSFAWFWLAAGIGCLLLCVAIKYMKYHDLSLPRSLRFGGILLFTLGMCIFTVVEGTLIYHANQKPDKNVDYLIVLGAQVRGTRITKSLKKRLDSAATYLKENETTKAIVSGGKGPGEDIAEAEAMMNYLIQQGIAKDRIVQENQSTNTKENIEFSKRLIKETDATVAIVTNGFHIFRATSIAKKQNIGQVQGLSAPSDSILFINYYVREGIAVLKDKLVGNF